MHGPSAPEGLYSFEAIAEQISRIGRGQAQAMVQISAGLTFPPDYTIGRQACHKAFKKAIAREPSLELGFFTDEAQLSCDRARIEQPRAGE